MVQFKNFSFPFKGVSRFYRAVIYNLEIIMLGVLVGIFALGLWIFFTFAWQSERRAQDEGSPAGDGALTVPTDELMRIVEVLEERKTHYNRESDTSGYPDLFR